MARPRTFTDRENRIRRYLRSNAWRKDPINIDYARQLRRNGYYRNREDSILRTRQYEAEHPGYKQRLERRQRVELAESYCRRCIRRRLPLGTIVTSEMVDAFRKRTESLRSRSLLRLNTL